MLNRIIVDNLYKIPHDIDIVVGVPRSGLLAANLNKPLTDVVGILSSRIFDAGISKNKTGWAKNIFSAKQILVVEDSVASGNSLMKAKVRLQNLVVEKTYLSVIAELNSAHVPDIFLQIVPQPRVFEWNYMHHAMLRNCCVDMDGVLCQDLRSRKMMTAKIIVNFALMLRRNLFLVSR